MDNFAAELSQIVVLMKQNLPLTLKIIGVLWIVNLTNWIFFDSSLNRFCIIPRHVLGLPGIFVSPFLHAGFNHLFFNSIPLFMLVDFMLLAGVNTFVSVTLIIIVLGGLGVWLFGRRAIHLGASGLVMGYWGYLLYQAYYQPQVLSVALALIVLYYFGGLIYSLFSTDEKVSWEGHLFGFIAGLSASYLSPLLLLWWHN